MMDIEGTPTKVVLEYIQTTQHGLEQALSVLESLSMGLGLARADLLSVRARVSAIERQLEDKANGNKSP
jgi:hypothetical protein